MYQTGSLNFFIFIMMSFIIHQGVQSAPHQRTFRLCSRSLSDAMFLVCKDRGFYEPFSYTDGIDFKSGPGLVDECCYQACSYEQLEQYCKPLANGENANNAGIEESLRIVNLPYSSRPTEENQQREEEEEKEAVIKSKKLHHDHHHHHHHHHHPHHRNSVNDAPGFDKQTGWMRDSTEKRQGEGIKSSTKLLIDECLRRRKKRRRCAKVVH